MVVAGVVDDEGPTGTLVAGTDVFNGILMVNGFVVLKPGTGRVTVTFTVPLCAVPLGVAMEKGYEPGGTDPITARLIGKTSSVAPD